MDLSPEHAELVRRLRGFGSRIRNDDSASDELSGIVDEIEEAFRSIAERSADHEALMEER